MVMINFSLLDEPLTIKAMTTLVVQDVSVFSSLIRQCYQYGETNELQLFDTKLKALKESEVMLITDILGYDVNAPAILKMIHADLEESFNSQP